jgi:hypothetical protein
MNTSSDTVWRMAQDIMENNKRREGGEKFDAQNEKLAMFTHTADETYADGELCWAVRALGGA